MLFSVEFLSTWFTCILCMRKKKKHARGMLFMVGKNLPKDFQENKLVVVKPTPSNLQSYDTKFTKNWTPSYITK